MSELRLNQADSYIIQSKHNLPLIINQEVHYRLLYSKIIRDETKRKVRVIIIQNTFKPLLRNTSNLRTRSTLV